MNRLILSAAALAAALCACGGDENPAPADASAGEALQKPEARASFAGVILAAEQVRIQAELCLAEAGFAGYPEGQSPSGGPAECSNGARGEGWRLYAPGDYAGGPVASVEVRSGVITATAVRDGGLNGASVVLVPRASGSGRVNWKRDDDASGCVAAKLC